MKTTKNKISRLSVVLLGLAALLLTISVFVPLWRIDLDAPQYPEGLRLLIHPNKIGGNVDIINGLNHYIGMKTLHTEDFVEFTVLPYLIGFFAVFSLVCAVAGNRRLFYVLFTLFVLFGVVAMVDFWRWEYNYGHNLDPNAAIIVPGMAYQPPLIGFKQLLNFGAFSVPAAGGWLFVGSGVLMLIAFLKEKSWLGRKNRISHAAILLTFLIVSCSGPAPDKVRLNYDHCDFCKMTISDAGFVSQLISAKGRTYKFDDAACMRNYISENAKLSDGKLFVANFESPGEFLEVHTAIFVQGGSITSPMGGNAAAFSSEADANRNAAKSGGAVYQWEDLPD